jgi:hypothetical protein
MKLRCAKRGWVKEWRKKERRANPGSGAQMGLRSAYPRGGTPTSGGVRSVQCILGVPEGIEVLPSWAEKRRWRDLECRMGQGSTERRNGLWNEIEEVQSRLRSSASSGVAPQGGRGGQGCDATADGCLIV